MSTDTEYTSPADFAAKVDWEGGISGALEYGLKHTDLDPDDEAAKPLREAWKQLEYVYRGGWHTAVENVREALDAAVNQDGEDEADGPDVRINLLRTDDHIEVWVNGDLAASTDYDQAGHAGMDAVENAVVRIANAVGIELGEGGGK